jgi:hypothetical protein
MAPVKLSDNLPPAPVKLSDNFTGVEKNVYFCAKNDMVRNMFQSLQRHFDATWEVLHCNTRSHSRLYD